MAKHRFSPWKSPEKIRRVKITSETLTKLKAMNPIILEMKYSYPASDLCVVNAGQALW